jgi:hypothetical protein
MAISSLLLFSYIDPVSGFILLQMVIGGCIGCFAFLSGKMGGGVRLLNPFYKSKLKSDLQSTVDSSPQEK